MHKSSSESGSFPSRNLKHYLQAKPAAKSGPRLGALLTKSRSKHFEASEGSLTNQSEAAVLSGLVATRPSAQAKKNFSVFQQNLLSGAFLKQSSQREYLKMVRSPSGKIKSKRTTSFEHHPYMRSPSHAAQRPDPKPDFVDAGTGSQEIRSLEESKDDTLGRLAQLNKNHMNPYLRRHQVKSFARKLSKESNFSKRRLSKGPSPGAGDEDLELPDIYAQASKIIKQKSRAPNKTSSLSHLTATEKSLHSSVNSISMALNEPRAAADGPFKKRSLSNHSNIIVPEPPRTRSKPRFTASMLTSSPKTSTRNVKKQSARDAEESPLSIHATTIHKPKDKPELFKRNSKFLKRSNPSPPKRLTRAFSGSPRADNLAPSPPEKTLTTEKSRREEDEMFETHLSHIMRQNSEKNTRSNSRLSVTPPAIGILKYKVVSRGGLGAFGSFKLNQDSKFVVERFMDTPGCWYLGVCDGHGANGHHASQFVVAELPSVLQAVTRDQIRQLGKQIEDGEKAMPSMEVLAQHPRRVRSMFEEAFKAVNNGLGSQNYDIAMSGSTACTLLVVQGTIYSANVGDSRAVLGRLEVSFSSVKDIGTRKTFHWKARRLTRDHKPDEEPEKTRILQNNGRVEPLKDHRGQPIGPMRVWLRDDPLPGLAMSRSFGDKVAAFAGVTAVPEVEKVELSAEDKFLIVASDGVWEYITDEEAVRLVSRFWNKRDVNMACQKLVEEARLRWKQHSGTEEPIDDITAVVLFLGKL